MKAKASKRKSSLSRPVLRGKGDYTTDITSIKDPISRIESKVDHLEKKLVGKGGSINNAAATVGRTLGNFVGQGELGALAGSSLAKLFGHGDYQIKTNSLMASHDNSSGAKFARDGPRGTRVTEREFIGNVQAGALSSGSTVFTLSKYNLNPTDPATFPWLSRMAHLYDQWEPHGIVFEYVSTSSDFNGSSQQLGAVIMATDYDPFDIQYASKAQMENADYCCSSKPSVGLLHGIECATSERPTKLLFTNTSNGAPVTSTSLGNFQIATQGCSAASATLGELWISYDITFYKKQLENFEYIPFYSSAGISPPSQGALAGATKTSSSVITTTSGTSSTIIYFNNKVENATYMVYWRCDYWETGQIGIPTTTTGCTTLNSYNGTTANPYSVLCIVKTTSLNVNINFVGKSGSTGTNWVLQVAEVNPNLTAYVP